MKLKNNPWLTFSRTIIFFSIVLFLGRAEVVASENLVPNGSFEAGYDCGWGGVITEKDWGFNLEVNNDPQRYPVIDTTTAAQGKKSLRISAPENSRDWISSAYFAVSPEKRYTVSVYLKSDRNDAKVTLRLGSGTWGHGTISKTCMVGKEWERYSVSGTAKNPYYYVKIDVLTSGTIWADGVQVEAGELSDYNDNAPVDIGFYTGKDWQIYKKGETIPLTLEFVRHNPEVKSLNVTYSVKDAYLNEKPYKKDTILFSETDYTQKGIELPSEKYGVFKLCVEFSNEAQKVQGLREFIYAVVPERDKKGFLADSPFGVTWGFDAHDVGERIGVKWTSLDGPWYTFWTQVEPQKGQYVWYDKMLQKYLDHNMLIMGLFHQTPGWAVGKPEEPRRILTGYYPENFTDWNNYVAKTAAHYKGMIKYWEVWGEPYGATNLSHGTTPPEKGTVNDPAYYVRLLKETYETVKKVDPEIKVVGVAIYPGFPKYLEAVLKEGALNYMDILAVHDYTQWTRSPETFGGGTAVRMKVMRDLMKKYGEVKPIWNTEWAYLGTSFYTDRLMISEEGSPEIDYIEAAAMTIRMYLTGLANGVERMFYFNSGGKGDMPRQGNSSMGFFDYDGSPSAKLPAFAGMTYILEGAEVIKDMELALGVKGVVFKKADKQFVVALWSVKERMTLKVNLAQPGLVRDMMGNILSNQKKKGEVEIDIDSSPRYLISSWNDADAAVKCLEQSKIIGLQPFSIRARVLNDKDKGLSLGLEVIGAVREAKESMLRLKKSSEELIFSTNWIKIADLKRGEAKKIIVPLKSAGTTETTALIEGTITDENDSYPVKISVNLLRAEQLKKNIQIDGNLSDWGNSSWIDINRADQVKFGYTKLTLDPTDYRMPIYPYWHGDKDLSGRVSAGWDKDNLYLAFRVTDDKVNLDKVSYDGDALELFLDFDQYRDLSKKVYSKTTHQIIFVPGTAGQVKPACLWQNQPGREIQGMQMASQLTSQGYILEVKIPFSNFGGFIPRAGETVAFDVSLDDKDSEPKLKTVMIWAGEATNWQVPANFGTLLFAE